MQLVLASGNSGKIREFKQLLGDKIVAFSELMESFEIVEDGDSFSENALIKARAIYERLGEGFIVISDDSGISVPLLGYIPGIYSARYAGVNATAKDNLYKLIEALKERGIKQTPAHYTAAIAVVGNKQMEYVVHGWMYGDVIDKAIGDKGFGYDPMFIPEGYDKTLAELGDEVKIDMSHRTKALELAEPIIQMLQRRQ
ncbi:MAG: non-canonical purine NTP pyrophosphatase [Sulfurovum sp.]|nr:non-canonical purine NTP pyrophosphatase [Sulfurovum sp.]